MSTASNAAPSSSAAPSTVFQGSNVVAAPAERVWMMLQDPVVLGRVIPGLSEIVKTGPGRFIARLAVGVGPIRGKFKITLQFDETQAPEQIGVQVEGRNMSGLAVLDAQLHITDLGEGSRVDWTAVPRLSGLIAGLGNRLIDTKARESGAGQRYADNFFSRLSQEA
jgi:uncharacterized protein